MNAVGLYHVRIDSSAGVDLEENPVPIGAGVPGDDCRPHVNCPAFPTPGTEFIASSHVARCANAQQTPDRRIWSVLLHPKSPDHDRALPLSCGAPVVIGVPTSRSVAKNVPTKSISRENSNF